MVNYNFEYDTETGVTTCFITDKQGRVYTGWAMCHPDDKDMMAEYTGKSIAEARATINMLRSIRDNDIAPQAKALRMLQTNMKQSKNYNPKSYEAKMLRRALNQREAELEEIKLWIKQERDDLRMFITEKEKAYQSVRRHRAEAAALKGQNETK